MFDDDTTDAQWAQLQQEEQAMSERTRDEHVIWCKQRALEYINRGQINEGLTSMMSDMSKHPETKSSALDQLTIGLMMIGSLNTIEAARKHINGYN